MKRSVEKLRLRAFLKSLTRLRSTRGPVNFIPSYIFEWETHTVGRRFYWNLHTYYPGKLILMDFIEKRMKRCCLKVTGRRGHLKIFSVLICLAALLFYSLVYLFIPFLYFSENRTGLSEDSMRISLHRQPEEVKSNSYELHLKE